ncbi:glutamate--cysteine ligase [Salinarchaeum sp. IM2453]|uniref:glutamate--cysteine ligase n=1 Tax=Salinarchaeum sp. IM2453 TaxID=2862870 RepID=UPI001C83BED1|nr:glutamate--cysteine ligase [Salinarchaeum sp. IM2453]
MECGAADVFTDMGTIGVEEEFYIVDDQGRPISGTDTLVYNSTPPDLLTGKLDHELFKCVIETQTSIIEDFENVHDVVEATRSALCTHAENHGMRIAAAGLHPTANWRTLEHAEKPRYKEQLDRIQYPQHRNLTAGLHVHVGVNDPDKATWIANELRWYVPIILALSANSPYWCGFDTGLQSARAKIFENLPNTGIPTSFSDFSEYRQYEKKMLETGSVNDRGEIWFDVRPHTGHGTVEVRTPDAQVRVDRVVDFVEYVHALVHDLADRYTDGESQTDIRREILDENKWRAIRHGHEADFILPSGDPESLDSIITRHCDRLDITGIRRMFDEQSGAEQQRECRQNQGVDTLCESLLL